MFKRMTEKEPYVKKRSNIIQYDTMGYPLRLCITRNGNHCWIDTHEKDGDLVLKWKDNE